MTGRIKSSLQLGLWLLAIFVRPNAKLRSDRQRIDQGSPSPPPNEKGSRIPAIRRWHRLTYRSIPPRPRRPTRPSISTSITVGEEGLERRGQTLWLGLQVRRRPHYRDPSRTSIFGGLLHTSPEVSIPTTRLGRTSSLPAINNRLTIAHINDITARILEPDREGQELRAGNGLTASREAGGHAADGDPQGTLRVPHPKHDE